MPLVRPTPHVGEIEERALKAELVRRARRRERAKDSYAPTRRELALAEELRGTWFPQQAAFYRSTKRRRVAFCSRRAGKCNREGTLVMTPLGPRAIETLRSGDEVYGWSPDDTVSLCHVTELHDQGMQDVVDLVSGPRVYATCTREHRWLTTHAAYPDWRKVRRVDEFYTGVKVCRRYVEAPLGDVHEPHAYALGALLGDGYGKGSGVQISSSDDLVPARVAQALGTTWRKANADNFTYAIHAPRVPHASSPIHHYDDWIRGRLSHEKQVSLEVVRTWDRESALQFLAGLVDTDCSVSHTATRVSLRIGMQAKSVIDAAEYLLQALFMVTTARTLDNRAKYKHGPVYQVAITDSTSAIRVLKGLGDRVAKGGRRYCPSMDNKAHLPTAHVGVKPRDAGRAQCYDITVDNETSLYLLANGLVTHNTIGSAKWFLADMLEHPNGLNLYIAQTAGVARIYMWRELKEIVKRCNLPFIFNSTNLYMEHKRGGGLLLLKGADKADEIQKLRGPKYRKVLLDEAQSFGTWVEPLINEVLGAALRDEHGELLMTGTAGKNKEGAYYEACHGLKKRRDGSPVYELHRWTLQENPYLSELAKDEGEIIDDEGYSGPDDPRFLREYRGEWVIGDEERMFAFDERINVYDGPLPTNHNFKTGFGVDFGWHDMTAFAAGQWSQTSQVFYCPETWGKKHQYTDDVAAKASELGFKYDSRLFIGDTGGYGKNVAVHLQRDYRIHIIQAQKREKYDHIAFFNSALRRGEIKVRRGDPVIRQLREVAWNANRTDAANHSRDDLVFALLYIWRFAKNHGLGKIARPAESKIDAGTAFAIREKQEALHAPRETKSVDKPWVIRDTGAASNSARYCSEAWSILLGNR